METTVSSAWRGYEYILFDLDGTLSQSGPGITRCAQYALRAFGIDEPDLKKLEVFVGPPLNLTFQQVYGFSAEQSAEAVRLFQERYEREGVFENALYPGVDEMLRSLHAAGRHLAIASSKPRHLIPMILGRFGIAEYFEAISAPGFEQELTNKMGSDNKQLMVRLALEELGIAYPDLPDPCSRGLCGCIREEKSAEAVSPMQSALSFNLTTDASASADAPRGEFREGEFSDAIKNLLRMQQVEMDDKASALSSNLSSSGLRSRVAMVGDRFYDIQGALANQVTAIGVTYGYGSRKELEEAGADIVVDSPGELQAVLLGNTQA